MESTLIDKHNSTFNSIIRNAEQTQTIHYDFTAQNSDLTLKSKYKKLNNPKPNLFETNVIGQITWPFFSNEISVLICQIISFHNNTSKFPDKCNTFTFSLAIYKLSSTMSMWYKKYLLILGVYHKVLIFPWRLKRSWHHIPSSGPFLQRILKDQQKK